MTYSNSVHSHTLRNQTQQRQPWRWTKSKFAIRLFSLCRWLHVYLSIALLSLMLFFSVTGITLNHTEWLSQGHVDGELQHPLPPSLETALTQYQQQHTDAPLDDLSTFLAVEFNLNNPESINIDNEMEEILFDFQLPAGYASAIFDLSSATLVLEYRKGSLLQLMNDLHKGRHTSEVWSWIIDVSAGLMLIFSIAGLVILFQNRKYRGNGIIIVVFGALTPVLIYFMFVPRLTGI